ncbi:MAG: hypothetical protein IPO30_19565 [Hyphomonadaceae bacterium]|nr:hypothetical protein [Hyphomonadaceae bacterium]
MAGAPARRPTLYVGRIVLVSAGGRIPLDGVIVSGDADLDTAIVNGARRSVRNRGTPVLSGMLNINSRMRGSGEPHDARSFISSAINMMGRQRSDGRTTVVWRTGPLLYTPVVHALAEAASSHGCSPREAGIRLSPLPCPCLSSRVPDYARPCRAHGPCRGSASIVRTQDRALKDGSALGRAAESQILLSSASWARFHSAGYQIVSAYRDG